MKNVFPKLWEKEKKKENDTVLTESKRWYYASYICCISFRPITLRGYFRIKYIKAIISVYRNIKILSI